jgi:hypothetical protein
MMLEVDIDLLTKWSGVLAAVFTGIGWMIRLYMKYLATNKLKNKEEELDLSVYAKMEKQIEKAENREKAMEEENHRLQTRMEQREQEQEHEQARLEAKIELIRVIENEGAPDLGMLTAYVKQLPCPDCNRSKIVYEIQEVMNRINERRIKKSEIIKN